jgi:hypothetical protein
MTIFTVNFASPGVSWTGTKRATPSSPCSISGTNHGTGDGDIKDRVFDGEGKQGTLEVGSSLAMENRAEGYCLHYTPRD